LHDGSAVVVADLQAGTFAWASILGMKGIDADMTKCNEWSLVSQSGVTRRSMPVRSAFLKQAGIGPSRCEGEQPHQ